MPEHAEDLSIRTIQHATFALPAAPRRAVAYLGDPAVVLSALPSVERIVQRQRGTFRVTLAPVQIPRISLRPAAEVMFVSGADHVRIESVREEPHALQAGEIAMRVTGLFLFAAARAGCTVRASLAIDAAVPAHHLPPLMPRVIAHRTAEAVLVHRMKQEIAAMTRALVRGYPAWEGDGAGLEVRSSE